MDSREEGTREPSDLRPCPRCSQPAPAGEQALAPRAVAVVVACEHPCMATRDVKKRGATTITTQCLGLWESDVVARAEILRQLED